MRKMKRIEMKVTQLRRGRGKANRYNDILVDLKYAYR